MTVDHSDNGVLIQWEPSADTDIEFYNLWKMNQDLSFFRLFSFNASTLEYKHMTSGLTNLAYTVTAKDSSGNESLFGQNVHRAVQVLAEFDPIASAIKVIWTAYEGWEGDISGYRLHGGLTGDTPDELAFVPHTTKQWYHTSIIADTTYKYYIETVNINGITSLSPIDSVSTYPEGVRIGNRNISEFQIYPNPTYNFIILHLPDATNWICDILCSNGQIIQSLTLSGSTHQLDFSSFQMGVYFVTIRSKDFVTTKKIFKL